MFVNKFYLFKKPTLASPEWDDTMANPKVQKSIASSKNMRFSYACTERDISLNYSMLLDI